MQDIDITPISPATDAQAARLASPATLADLAGRITATPVPAVSPRLFPRPPLRPRSPGRRALLASLPLAVLGAAAALLVTLLGATRLAGTGGGGDTGANSQAAIQALSFTKEHGYIKVIVRNPEADASWYNADFARHHLDITLTLVPVSPSLTGTVVMISTDSTATGNEITTITAKGRCWTGGGGAECPVGLKVPLDFHGSATLTFGRAAKPGEQYESVGSVFSSGEALAGLRSQVVGQPVSKVWPLLAEHHVTIAVCRDAQNNDVNPDQVPGDYYVNSILPWAPGQVIVWTSPDSGESGGPDPGQG